MNVVPEHITRLRQWLKDAVSRLETKFPFAQASFSEQDGLSIMSNRQETRVSEIASRRGIVLSVFNGQYTAELGLSHITEDAVQAAVTRLIERISVDPGDVAIDPGSPWTGDFQSEYQIHPQRIALKDKIERLTDIRQILTSASPRVASASVRYGERTVRKVYVNRVKDLYQELIHVSSVPVVIVSDGRATKTLHSGNGFQAGFEKIEYSREELLNLVHETETLLEAGTIEPGTYDVIGGPGLAGVIAHEAFGHGVEADMFLKQRAKAVDYLGKQVASPLVNLIDSPLYKGFPGSYFFDDEGMPASDTRIIEHGILRNVLTDLRSATLLGIPRSANSRREAFSNKIYARMTNTFFAAGDSTRDEMIASVDKGLYMPHGSNGMEDPKNWGIQVESPFALEILHGKLTGRVFAPVVITGFVPDLLNSISMVGNDLHLEGLGICQKGHKEQVPVAIGGPHLKMIARVG